MSETDNYNQATEAPAEWWSDVQVKDYLIVAGGDGICVDDIKTFAGKLASVKEVELVVGERGGGGRMGGSISIWRFSLRMFLRMLGCRA
jgi:hypothetical protein